jgi:hypothetical protein
MVEVFRSGNYSVVKLIEHKQCIEFGLYFKTCLKNISRDAFLNSEIYILFEQATAVAIIDTISYKYYTHRNHNIPQCYKDKYYLLWIDPFPPNFPIVHCVVIKEFLHSLHEKLIPFLSWGFILEAIEYNTWSYLDQIFELSLFMPQLEELHKRLAPNVAVLHNSTLDLTKKINQYSYAYFRKDAVNVLENICIPMKVRR